MQLHYQPFPFQTIKNTSQTIHTILICNFPHYIGVLPCRTLTKQIAKAAPLQKTQK